MQSKQEELKRENESLKKIIMEKFSTIQKQTDECNNNPLFSSNVNFNNRNLF
jgi:hypothetical protein